MKKVNVALIGYKFMGRAHSNAWRQAATFFEPPVAPVLKVICGRDEAGVRDAAARFGWQEHATDWEKIVRRDDIDVVDICTPGDTHLPIALAAAEAGKVILCEKPLANNVADAERMLDAVRSGGSIHMLCHNYRRVPAVALAKRLIEEGRIGEVRHYRGTYLQDWLVNPDVPRVWRLEKSRAGSGALGDLLSHSADLARYLVGEITEVCGMLKTFVPERPAPGGGGVLPVEVDDAALTLVRFEGGAVGSIEATRFATGRRNYNRFEINGSRGSIAFNLERMNELELYTEEGPESGFRTILATDPSHPYMGVWWPPGHIIGYEHTFTHTVLDLLRAVAERRQPKPDFEDGVRAQRILDAVERTSLSRTWESV
ncbi:MAG TPA: Gfo/Idh/MocA family oxidoreductase [Pyrinomonadaceae bacterium]|nr:Gfo/Idh/MocA family oxidoreductase [Pyrinomonadaceae bacterium]